MQQNITAFADEFGNNSFDFESQGTHFIVATIICKNENLEKLRNDIDSIRKQHGFQTGEMKSSGVAQNYSRRKRVLADIAKLDITIYAVIVDKTKLNGKGFAIKKSFYKYLNNLVYKELYRTFPKLELPPASASVTLVPTKDLYFGNIIKSLNYCEKKENRI
ncbi:DUF3800 domain-containing protein [Flavobacterium sp. ZT3R25]|uniref:DUF3800 domain-containing protein n=1 Tax=Flavobacterium galactosi TaxID=3398735 RepID=UPI003A89B9B9